MDMRSNYTLSFDNQYSEEMLKTFMACQYCKKVSARMKQLQCGHTICQKCVMLTRKKKDDQWLLRCNSCRVVTVCYGESMRELRDVMTVQKLVEKSRSNPDSAVYNSRMPPRWEDNLSISIVSSAKEKQEIRKVYESAKGKMQACQEQRKQVQYYENKVQSAKMKLQKQIKESVEAYIAAIRTHEDQLLDDLNQLFKEDFRPIEEALDCLEMQMQSLKLVTECCSVAGKILKGGGAPMDMNTFKKMVRETMSKTKAGKLPSVIQKAYRPKIFYKPNDDQYDELAERLGKLARRREKKNEGNAKKEQERKTRADTKARKEEKQIGIYGEEEDEPIYDFPPELEAKRQAQMAQPYVPKYVEEEGFYDEIPFFTQQINQSNYGIMEAHSCVSNFPQSTPTKTQLSATRSVPLHSSPEMQTSGSFTVQPSNMEQTSGVNFIPPAPPLPPSTSGTNCTPQASSFHPTTSGASSIPTPPPFNPSLLTNLSTPAVSAPPPPIAKNNYASKAEEVPKTPSTIASQPCQLIDDNTVALFAKRRLAINGDESDFSEEQSESE